MNEMRDALIAYATLFSAMRDAVVIVCVILSPAIVLSSLTATFARYRGHHWGRFFLLSMLITPVGGFIAALLYPKDQAGIDAFQVKRGYAQKCVACAELIRPEANVCNHCGAITAPAVARRRVVAA